MLTEEQIKKFDALQAYVSCECDWEQASFDFDEMMVKVADNFYILQSDTSLFDDDDYHLQDIIDIPKLAKESYTKLRDIFLIASGCELTRGDYRYNFSDTFIELLNQLQYTEEAIEVLQPYFKMPIECYETQGYSQGDYSFVLLFGEEVTDEKRNAVTHETINHVFWDAPIYCRLVFGDGSDFIAEVADNYEYDKETYLKSFIEQLAPEMPDEPSS